MKTVLKSLGDSKKLKEIDNHKRSLILVACLKRAPSVKKISQKRSGFKAYIVPNASALAVDIQWVLDYPNSSVPVNCQHWSDK